MKAKKLISWKVVDRYKSADGIYRLLLKNGIKGRPLDNHACPLAVATGYRVGAIFRWRKNFNNRDNLTPSQAVFVSRFDRGDYPELERK